MQNQIEEYKNSITPIKEQIENIVVRNDEDVATASDITKRIKEVRLKVEAEKEEYVKPAKEIIAKAKNVYDPVILNCKQLEDTIKGKNGDYIIAKNQKIRQEQEKIAKQMEEGKIKEEVAIRKMEQVGEEAKSIRGEISQIRVSERKDVEIFDETLLPREYLVPDFQKIKKVVLAGIEVPGAKIVKKVITSQY